MHEGTGDFIKLSVVVNHGCWWQTKVDIHVECLSGVSGPGAGWRAGRDGDCEWRCGAGGRGVEPSGASQQLGADHSAAHCMQEHE